MAKKAALGSGLIWLLFAFQTTAFAQKQAVSTPLGQVVAETVEIDGMTVPSGTTLVSGNVIQTREGPASIHLTGHRVIRLGANSRARAEAGGDGAVRLTLQSGTVSMRSDSGEAITVPAERVLYFAQQPTASPQQRSSGDMPRDVVAVLEVQSAVGTTSIMVNDASKIDASQPIQIRRRNADVGEVHYIKSIEGKLITLTAPLSSTFPRRSLVLQGESTRAVLTEPRAGTTQPGRAGRPNGGSRARTIGLVAGIGAGAAGLIIYQATKSSSEPDRPASPSQP